LDGFNVDSGPLVVFFKIEGVVYGNAIMCAYIYENTIFMAFEYVLF